MLAGPSWGSFGPSMKSCQEPSSSRRNGSCLLGEVMLETSLASSPFQASVNPPAILTPKCPPAQIKTAPSLCGC